LIDSGSVSSPVSTVAPLAENPDIASKYASVMLMPGSASISGSAANAVAPPR
jgi:hypothetical protein